MRPLKQFLLRSRLSLRFITNIEIPGDSDTIKINYAPYPAWLCIMCSVEGSTMEEKLICNTGNKFKGTP